MPQAGSAKRTKRLMRQRRRRGGRSRRCRRHNHHLHGRAHHRANSAVATGSITPGVVRGRRRPRVAHAAAAHVGRVGAEGADVHVRAVLGVGHVDAAAVEKGVARVADWVGGVWLALLCVDVCLFVCLLSCGQVRAVLFRLSGEGGVRARVVCVRAG